MLTQFKWFWLNILCPELLQSIVNNKTEDNKNKKCNEINGTWASLTSSAKMPVCKTPVQKTNPNLKHKTKKQHQIKLLRNQFIYVEVAKKTLPEGPQVYNDFVLAFKSLNPVISGQWFCKVCKDL